MPQDEEPPPETRALQRVAEVERLQHVVDPQPRRQPAVGWGRAHGPDAVGGDGGQEGYAVEAGVADAVGEEGAEDGLLVLVLVLLLVLGLEALVCACGLGMVLKRRGSNTIVRPNWVGNEVPFKSLAAKNLTALVHHLPDLDIVLSRFRCF